MELTDMYGYITDGAVRRAYDRIISQPGFNGERAAEAFLRMCERLAVRNPALFRKFFPKTTKLAIGGK